MSQFAFLKPDFPDLHKHACKAELHALSDPSGACFWARLTVETAVKWLYRYEQDLGTTYKRTLSELLNEPEFEKIVTRKIVLKAVFIKNHGNGASHYGGRTPSPLDATNVIIELYHFCHWIAWNYARTSRPSVGNGFDTKLLEKSVTITATTIAQIQALEKEHSELQAEIEKSEAGNQELQAEIAELRAEVEALRTANEGLTDPHDYSEAETRAKFIDLLLRETGWLLQRGEDREFEVSGMPSNSGVGYVDYVLWGDDGKPLALVEAKKTSIDSRAGQRQAKLYADCLENQFGQRPIIFLSNGFEHWVWDDEAYPPRRISGFYKKDELELLQQRKIAKRPLLSVPIDTEIVERPYQLRAIKRVGETFEKDCKRRALLVMATGSGKTRTVIALIDQLMRANLVKRVLFLADRVALVKQAQNSFKAHLPSVPTANLQEKHNPQKNDHSSARVCLSTYPSMMNLIDDRSNGIKRFGSAHFDLVVIDEAHRSVYKKYRGIFEYFDSLLVGLTATPRDEIDRDTYSLFGLERGVPTDSYDLEDAVKDGWLVPPRSISVPLKFQREGIKYDELSDEEKEEWDSLDWNEENIVPDEVDSSALNKWLFNEDTVDKVLKHLMQYGLKVEGGNKLGKTIIFAKSSDHANYIVERFDENYPHLKGHFAQRIDHSVTYAQSLIDDFSEVSKDPQIAVSVDMLDTGIDVPEVVNLVFFKVVRSRTKFFQMIGRGTRLCKNLFGYEDHKTEFLIFDFCQNFEFFNENPDQQEPRSPQTLDERLFITRVQLISELQNSQDDHAKFKEQITTRLYEEVCGMPEENFLVQAKLRNVTRFKDWENWAGLDQDAQMALIEDVAGLPTDLKDGTLPAKQFDLLILRAQTQLLLGRGEFAGSMAKIQSAASNLEGLSNIPTVAAQMELILDIQTTEFWEGITLEILEDVRKRLRNLVELIEAPTRKRVFTNFEDEIGDGEEFTLPGVSVGVDKEKFKMKVRYFLEDHKDHISLIKIKRGETITSQDLSELEKILLDAGAADQNFLSSLENDGGLGVFLRSLIGLELNAVQLAFSDFISGNALNADQIEFVDQIIKSLSENGIVDPAQFYESPFTDFSESGISGVFDDEQAGQVIQIVRQLNEVVRVA